MSGKMLDDSKQDDVYIETAPSPGENYAADRTAATEAETREIEMTTRQALRFYWKAVVWSMIASSVIIMEGFDSLLGNFFVLQPFLKKYGDWNESLGKYVLTAEWQMGLTQAVSVGCIVGVIAGAYQVDRLGYRWSMISNLVALSGFIGMCIFSPNRIVLLFGEFLCGTIWGAVSMMSTSYASEVCPIQLRGYLTSYVNMCWIIGGFINSGIMNGYVVHHQDEVKGYLLPWSLQWIWPVPLMIGMFLAPESPWWLVRKRRYAEAEAAVKRLQANDNVGIARKSVALMVHTNALELELASDASFAACFTGTDLRRTEIACVSYAGQMLCGCVLSWSTVFFFVQAGMSNKAAFGLGLGQSGIALIGTVIAWFLLAYTGRRTIYLCGMTAMFTILIVIGVCSVIADQGHRNALWAQAACLLLWVLVYTISVGPVAFTIIGESSSTRLRNKTIGLARLTYNCVALIAGLLNPFMINATSWNWGGKSGFFWAGTCGIGLAWCYFRLPEMKNRSYRELDILFERRVPARQFKTTVVGDADEEIFGSAKEGVQPSDARPV